ncbi:MAG: ATP-binding cassette domain-containing protein, partial [Bifidobacterium psychraerophilum]|uniref:ATP-binding cassette domain-containing protein n=1 Tax=Bifidobacterium psychraerophilum TaxID=218140 RepID=UPI0039E831CC
MTEHNQPAAAAQQSAEALETVLAPDKPLLEVKDLKVDFTTDTGGSVHAVRDASFNVYPGQWVAIVGESGSGKSTSAMAVLGLLPGTGHVVGGSITLEGKDISDLSRKEYEHIRGREMGLVPQDPMSNLNPVWRIGKQVEEALKANGMDVKHEKRSNLSKAFADAEVDLQKKDDELFISSKELPALLAESRQALDEAGVRNIAKKIDYFTGEWIPGSETRGRVAQ